MWIREQRKVGSSVGIGIAIVASMLSAAAAAANVSHGEMAAAIRSANYPCAHVLKVESNGDNAWVVQCNSGQFLVSRDQDGKYTATQSSEKQEN